MRSPPPAPGGTGLAGRLALPARSSDGTASAFARFLAMHPGHPPSRPCPIPEMGSRGAGCLKDGPGEAHERLPPGRDRAIFRGEVEPPACNGEARRRIFGERTA